jgi:GT2 family glycosyltransferase
VRIANKYADKVFSVKKYGLGYKRNFGIKEAFQSHVLILDADCILPNGSLEIMLSELQSNGYVGIQSQLKGVEVHTFCERAMEYDCSMTHSKPIETIVIGTPALWDREVLLEINYDQNIGACDDTDLCYRLKKSGYKLGISSAIGFTKHRKTWREIYKKFSWYGEGDCEFALKHPERALSIFTHPIRNYAIKRSLKALFSLRGIRYIPFFIFIGVVRHLSFYKFLLRTVLGNKVDCRQIHRKDMEY